MGPASGPTASSVKIKWRTTMPLIEVHLIENVFDSVQKEQIIEKLTDAWLALKARTCVA